MSYIEIWSPNKNSGTGGFKKSIIVIHTSEPGPYAPGRNPGTAANLGRYLQSASVQASYHMIVDPNGDKCRCLSNADRAWAAGPIANNEGFHICAVGWAAWSRQEWLSMPKMLDGMAEEIALWCKAEGIPAQYVVAKDLPNDIWGITTHLQTALAWRQTDHSDPGPNFPIDVLIEKVKAYMGGSVIAPVEKETAIQAKRRIADWLGKRVIDAEEFPTPDGIGRFCDYENGMIYWTPATGAQAMSNEMVDKYATVGYEKSFLGYPINDVHDLPDKAGRAQAFQNGSIYWSEKTKAQIVNGVIGNKWAASGWEKGELGFPTTDEIKLPDGVGIIQVFEKAHIYYTPASGAGIIKGLIWDEFTKQNFEKGLGYPLTDEIATANNSGVFQKFDFAQVYYKWGDARAYSIFNDILDIYARFGYETGRLGYPTSNRTLVEKTKWLQKFQGGSIQVDTSTKEVVLIIEGESISV
ncbi:lysin A [Rhodococcus phage Weasels2]|uniref:Lysin A n=1 Tax=Rhodococcus phage Weasels2 TaxID=1897437 RepID=A0A1I9SA50_9CAUD|nr:endolysin [Rhodococcus phage Weasels2]AOZ63656.1 lysin A [Rhodococcus phage Weasels2]